MWKDKIHSIENNCNSNEITNQFEMKLLESFEMNQFFGFFKNKFYFLSEMKTDKIVCEMKLIKKL